MKKSKKFMDMIIGNLTPFFKKKEIVIYMRSWDIKGKKIDAYSQIENINDKMDIVYYEKN